MTNVITRLYATEDAAKAVQQQLRRKGFPKSALDVIVSHGGTGTLTDKMHKAKVGEDAAAAYAKAMSPGAALLVVRATYKPLGAARIARELTAGTATIDAGLVREERYIPDIPEPTLSILPEHPRFLTLPSEPDELRRGLWSTMFGIPLLSTWRGSRQLEPHDRRYGRIIPLLSTWRGTNQLEPHDRRYGRLAPLLSDTPRRTSVIKGGGHPFSDMFGWPTVIRSS